MSTTLTVALLAVLTTVGLVAAVATDGAASLVLAVATVVVAGVLAVRLRSAPPGAAWAAALATGIVIVSAGIPATIVLTETGGRGSSAFAAQEEQPIDPSAELRRALAKAGDLLPGGADSVLSIDIDEQSTRVDVLDLAKGQRISANYSQSSDEWYDPSSTSTNDRADAAFRSADIVNLDVTAARRRVDDSARGLGVDLSRRSSSDGVVIARRSADKKLVATFDLTSRVKFETDQAGNLPDNLALAKVDGLLPAAERLLRSHGIDPAMPVLDELEYRVFAENASSVGSANPGTIDIRVTGSRNGTLKETVGRFPEIRLYDSSGTSSRAFALTAITAAGIEKARAELERRSAVPPIDAHAISLEVAGDTTSPGWMRGGLPPLLRLGLGPGSDDQAYFRPDGTFVKAAP
ncbi:hypothetical protein [Tsukamurella paurometabola]|uniref:Uncharacterized protein n=1 Tax=Tsukamurella paurometabola TaxID=2061 RepID=A0A3P8MBF6_TSUPA|nr:hypothetical protein [Tsukamurella paurometabola]UEA82302.1 hypothetical protein LK411_18300 [Tsukamurella paurometabola]VDR39350.1 Uncharacterised protein [Tsukamurella paurometabola]